MRKALITATVLLAGIGLMVGIAYIVGSDHASTPD
jgi:hypothetical protein